MIIKKFVGKNEEDAVEQAKKELGNGVVIMNVKQVAPGGLFGFLRAKKTEVTVALEDEKDIAGRITPPDLSAVRTAAAKTMTAAKNPESGPGITKALGGNTNLETTNVIEKKLDSLQSLLENQIKADRELAAKTKEVTDAETEEKNTTESDGAPNDKIEAENSEQEKIIKLLYDTLIDNEVDEKYANLLLDEMEKSKNHNLPVDHVLSNIYQKMVLKFGKSEEISPSATGPKIILFIGPTGVGKTTTIAKLSSKYVVNEKKKVALLTADTYRIAAAEQLRTYADILEVPFRVVYTAEEFRQACSESFQEYDYVFVDTAGHSHQNEQQLCDMGKLIDAIPENLNYQCFLVLSATTKYKDLLNIAKTYKEITDYQLIFTKLDETGSLGNLLNVKMAVDTPIAYITYGQNVPDDIEQFNPQKMVKQLLGGKG